MRILIIEDDCLFAELLQTFVEDQKCTTIVAGTLASAKELLSTSTFQFVLLDNHLPDGDGINFISTIKELSSTPLPVMLITGDSNQMLVSKAFDNGADDFLNKPLSLDLLWQKMQRVHSLFVKEAKLEEQAKSLVQLLDAQEREEKLARHVYEHISHALEAETECVDTYLQSSSVFNGDVFICDTAPNGNRFVILADATGHGLSAAISILPLVTTIKAMIRKGLSLPHIVHEANKKLCAELPDDKFVTLIGVEVNFQNQYMLLFNGGMPDIICVRHDKTLQRIPSASLALGIMEPEDFDPGILTIETHPLRNLFFFSDGLIEQQNNLGEEFGMERTMDILANWDSKEGLLSRMVNQFTLFNEMNELQDDLSICDLQIANLMEKHLYEDKSDNNEKTGKIIANITLEGNLIAASDIIGIFDGLMRSVDVVGDLRQKAFTVFAELISNALDHGILDLDSELKNDFAGFAEYLELKEERLANIKEHDTLAMSFTYIPSSQEMTFSIVDSGSGYTFETTKDIQDGALSGRGMSLINKLCNQVDVQAPGNNTSVTLKREF
ncbi:MAG: serine phosphatase RsbU (regulator of sigma subunit) [Alphaproteobacteria bacterium]|jgi:serine phosphatase RsbU (regulator of sigma subunit)